MQDEFVVMYQESKSLPKDALEYVLKKEIEMVAIFRRILVGCIQTGELELTEEQCQLYCTYTMSFKDKCGHSEDGHCIRNIQLNNLQNYKLELLTQRDGAVSASHCTKKCTQTKGEQHVYDRSISVQKIMSVLYTASSLFDGHDASINIMRRILQASGAEVIHLGITVQ